MLEGKQLLVQSFDTACKKSKCTQTSRGLGCCFQRLYCIEGGRKAIPLTQDYHNSSMQWCTSTSEKYSIMKGSLNAPRKHRATALHRDHSISNATWTSSHVNEATKFSMAHPNDHILMLWSYQEWETSCSHQWLKSQYSSGVNFCFLPRSTCGWAPDLFRGELLVHLCAVPKGTVPVRNRLQVIRMALEMLESPYSHSFVFVRSGTNSAQCLLTVHHWRSSPGEWQTRSELPGLYFELSQTQCQLREAPSWSFLRGQG